MKPICLAAALACTLFVTNAVAEITVGEYKTWNQKNLPAAEAANLEGLLAGISWANGSLAYSHQAPLYCEPGTQSPSATNAMTLINLELQGKTLKPDTPLALVLLMSLKTNFPCK